MNKDDSLQEEQPPKNAGSMAAELFEGILETGVELFHDQHNEPFIAINGDGSQVLKIRSKACKTWLAKFCWEYLGKPLRTDMANNLLPLLEGAAMFEGKQYKLHVRIARIGNEVWYDLGENRAVRITPEGWEEGTEPPIIFRRYQHQKPQASPERGGDFREISNYVNLGSDANRLLFEIFAVASFIPGFAHPLLVLHGPQGAGKTTPLKLLKSLIDPSELDASPAPKNLEAFTLYAAHHAFLFFDNLSRVDEWFSDALAWASTGGGFGKRELYTDDDEIIYSIQKSMALNGINLVASKPDLLDRSILIGLERINPENRREEEEYWKEVNERKPYWLGAAFEAIAKALQIYPTVKLRQHPRMADFTRWGCAIAEALGYTQQEFLDAYYQNIQLQNEEAIEASPVAQVVIAFMQDRDSWEGTPAELYYELEPLASTRFLTKSAGWARNPAWLSKYLVRVQPNLADHGIIFSRPTRGKERRISLQKTGKVTDVTDVPTDDTDDTTSEAENLKLIQEIFPEAENLSNDTTTVATVESLWSEDDA